MIRQCHRCELRFVTEGELNEHLAHDHRVETSVFEPYRYPRASAASPLYGDFGEQPSARRYLVVANQTLGGETLIEQIVRSAEAQPSQFHILTPATHSADYPTTARTYSATSPGGSSLGPTDERGLAQARWRLRRALEQLEELGVAASGELGDPNPLDAVTAVLSRERFDEVIVSTLPSSMSRWLGMDLPRWIERRWRLPVTTVVIDHPQTGPKRQ